MQSVDIGNPSACQEPQRIGPPAGWIFASEILGKDLGRGVCLQDIGSLVLRGKTGREDEPRLVATGIRSAGMQFRRQAIDKGLAAGIDHAVSVDPAIKNEVVTGTGSVNENR